jgi:hypothetical protein
MVFLNSRSVQDALVPAVPVDGIGYSTDAHRVCQSLK